VKLIITSYIIFTTNS